MTHTVFIIHIRQHEYSIGRNLFPLPASLNCLYFTVYGMHYIMKEAWLNAEVLSLYNG